MDELNGRMVDLLKMHHLCDKNNQSKVLKVYNKVLWST